MQLQKGLRPILSVPRRTNSSAKRFYSNPKTESSEPAVVGPGGPSDRIADMYEQSAGLERLEYLANLAQRPLFLTDPLQVKSFGTLQNPIAVQSISGKRIVGCTGFPADSHEIVWFECDVNKGSGRCPECGQAFAIHLVNQHLH